MMASDKSINAWQTGIVIFVLMFANKVLLFPSLLFEGAKFEAIFVPIILSALEMGLLYLFYRLKTKFPTQSFSYILKTYCGKFVRLVLLLLFMAYFLSKAILMYNVTYIFFKTVLYKNGDSTMFLICLLPIANHLACCGLRTMGRTMQLFFPVVFVLVAFCLLVGGFGINSTPIIFQGSFADVLKELITHVSAFGDMIFLFLIMHKIKIKKGQWKIVFSLSSISLLLVIGITIIFMLSYTYTAYMHPFAIFEIMNYVKEFGGTGRIDILSMICVIILTYFQLAIYLKGFMLAFESIFYKVDKLYAILSFDLLFVFFVNYVIQNLQIAVFFGENLLPYFSIFAFIIIPIISLLCEFLWQRRRT